MGVGGQRRAPVALPPGKTWYPLCTGLGGSQGRSGHVRKFSPLQEFGLPDRSESLYLLSYPGPRSLPDRSESLYLLSYPGPRSLPDRSESLYLLSYPGPRSLPDRSE